MKNYRILYLSILFLLTSLSLFSQEGYLDLAFKVTDSQSKPMKGVAIKLLQNGSEMAQVSTKKNGQALFNLLFDGDYKIVFSYPGHIEMHLIVYASTVKGEIYPSYQKEIISYSDTAKGIDAAVFAQPFLKLVFDGKENFIQDEEYAATFNPFVPEVKTVETEVNTTETEVKAAETKKETPLQSKSNYPEKFVFADMDKDNAISLLEVNSIIKESKSDKILVDELIDWVLE